MLLDGQEQEAVALLTGACVRGLGSAVAGAVGGGVLRTEG